jgi:hypothetical protein
LLLSQLDSFTLSGVKDFQGRILRARGSTNLDPFGHALHPPGDHDWGASMTQFFDNGSGNQNASVKVTQEFLAFNLDKVIQRRSVGDDDHRLTVFLAIDIAQRIGIGRKVIDVVGVVEDVPFLQKTLEVKSGVEAEKAARLETCQLARAISGNRQRLDGFAGGIGMLGQIVRQLDCDLQEFSPSCLSLA